MVVLAEVQPHTALASEACYHCHRRRLHCLAAVDRFFVDRRCGLAVFAARGCVPSGITHHSTAMLETCEIGAMGPHSTSENCQAIYP